MAVETRIMNCITCPMGCEMTVTLTDGRVTAVQGNSCPRGKKYAENEITAPQRMLTTSVRITGGLLPLLPVVSRQALPKGKILACAKALRQITVSAPVEAGQVICQNILGLGVDIVASRAMVRL
ncbi:MAG: DUF1667 domain-containing protein [Acidaminococcaceae bacterium]